jgi:isochorismate synthase
VKTSLKELQRYCLRHHIPFVSYALPGDSIPVSLFSEDAEVKIFKSIEDIDCSSGFILSPFQSESCPVIVIPDSLKATGCEISLKEFPKPSDKPEDKAISMNGLKEVSFQKYSSQIERIRKSLASGKAKKVVLSRTKVLDDLDYSQLPDVFEELVNHYTHAFVYLIYTPASGTWLGATPESLLQVDRKNFSTMALAGTKRFSGDSGKIKWTEKELKEHDYVADYVRQKLSTGGYHYHELARETVRAGNVVHLLTMFDGIIDHSNTAWKDLVTLLYPTPAICGTENGATLQLIREIEEHKREYYAGIIGPFNDQNKTNLFINLRCMKALGNAAVLFAGGGILDGSSALLEWEETEMKFDTLMRVVQKVKEKVNG